MLSWSYGSINHCCI